MPSLNKASPRLLITGAAGFVGHALCTELTQRKYCVRGTVREHSRSAGLDCELAIVGDIGPAVDWSAALDDVHAVVHLAARVHVMRERASNPLLAFRMANMEGTKNLARQAAHAGVRRFVYLSSIKVNGEQTLPGRPFTEQDAPAPLDFYSVSKQEAEEELGKIAQQTGMEVVIVRPPLVYGPGVKANFLNMMRWLHNGVPLPFGAIHNCRSLVALDNLIDFIGVCLEHPEAADQTFLVADGEDLSTTELLQRMGGALGMPAKLLPVPQLLLEAGFKIAGRSDMAQRLCRSLQVNIAKAQTLLGWNPPISVDEGLRRTAQWFLA